MNRNHRVKLAVPIVLAVALVSSLYLGGVHFVNASGCTTAPTPCPLNSSFLYFTPDAVPVPAAVGGTVTFNITADTIGGGGAAAGFNGWDFLVTAGDPAGLNLVPLSLTITPDALQQFGTVSELINCVNNGSPGGVPVATGQPGNTGCDSRDGAGLIHSSAVLLGAGAIAPNSGLVARITYNVVGTGTDVITTENPTDIGCAASGANPAPCDTFSDGTSIPDPHTTLSATFAQTAPDFNVQTINPAPITPGGSSTGQLNITSLNAYSASLVIFHTNVYPATGLTASCVDPGLLVANAQIFTNCTFSSNTPGIYYFDVNVADSHTNPTISHMAQFRVVVGDFSINALPATLIIPTGNTGTETITVSSVNGFTGSVALTTTIAPATGLTGSCPSPVTVPAGGSATSVCSFSSSTPGAYTVTVTGTFTFTGGTITHTVSFTVDVADFTITAPATATATAGTASSISATVKGLFNWNRNVLLTAVSSTGGPTLACGAQFVPTAAGTVRACTFTATTPGTFTVTFTATCGTAQGCAVAVSHTASTTLTVSGPAFSLLSVVQGTDGRLYWNGLAASGWSTWQPLLGSSPSAPALCSSGPGTVELVVRGNDNQIYHKTFSNGVWATTWDAPGGATTNAPTCAVLNGQLYVAVTGTDGSTYVTSRPLSSATWSVWISLGNPAPGPAPTGPLVPILVATSTQNRLDIIVRGSDNGIYHKAFVSGTWSSTWDSPNVLLHNRTTDVIAAVSDASALHVVVRGVDNNLHYDSFTFSTSSWLAGGWVYLLGSSPSAPALTIDSSGTLHLVVQGSDNQVWTASKPAGGSWSAWTGSAATTLSSPAIAMVGTSLGVLVRGSDSGIYYSTFAGSTWSTWVKLPGSTNMAPTLISVP